jgi:hypothetical protein
LSVARNSLAATTVDNYALFGGGQAVPYLGSITESLCHNTTDAYDGDLVRTTPTALSVGRGSLAATTVGDYALFGGGQTGNRIAVVDVYQYK